MLPCRIYVSNLNFWTVYFNGSLTTNGAKTTWHVRDYRGCTLLALRIEMLDDQERAHSTDLELLHELVCSSIDPIRASISRSCILGKLDPFWLDHKRELSPAQFINRSRGWSRKYLAAVWIEVSSPRSRKTVLAPESNSKIEICILVSWKLETYLRRFTCRLLSIRAIQIEAFLQILKSELKAKASVCADNKDGGRKSHP